MRKLINVDNFVRFVFLTFLASTVYVIIRLILAPSVAPSSDYAVLIKGDYIVLLLECIFGVVAMLLPGFLARRIRLSIPSAMILAYAAFIYCAIFLAEVRRFYITVPHWDTILHTFSGIAIGALGFSIVSILNDSDTTAFTLSPFFVALFAFCFALAIGVIWEFYEFTMDSLFDWNMQTYALESGEPFIGQAALVDTMKDLIVDAVGALVISVVGYYSLKKNRIWLKRFQITWMDSDSEGVAVSKRK